VVQHRLRDLEKGVAIDADVGVGEDQERGVAVVLGELALGFDEASLGVPDLDVWLVREELWGVVFVVVEQDVDLILDREVRLGVGDGLA
jgi:hypothetical protein